MRIKLVAPADSSVLPKLENLDIRVHSRSTYKETLLFAGKGAYGVPEIIGIRYPPEMEEKALAIHYGHDIRNQEEKVVDHGSKDDLIYKYSNLGFQPLGEFTVHDTRFSWKEFEGSFICIEELKLCFLRLYRTFPGNDTQTFEEKQRRAWNLFAELGFKVKDLLPVDYWGFLITTLMQGNQSTPQS